MIDCWKFKKKNQSTLSDNFSAYYRMYYLVTMLEQYAIFHSCSCAMLPKGLRRVQWLKLASRRSHPCIKGKQLTQFFLDFCRYDNIALNQRYDVKRKFRDLDDVANIDQTCYIFVAPSSCLCAHLFRDARKVREAGELNWLFSSPELVTLCSIIITSIFYNIGLPVSLRRIGLVK